MIIALNGKSGSGKDEIVKIIKSLTNHKVYHLSFAGKLRSIVCYMYGWSNDPQIDKSKPDPYWSKLLGTEWNMRTALITIGESIRNQLSQHWIALVHHEINKIEDLDNSLVIISDLRTEDELKFVKSLPNVKIWHVERPTHETQLSHSETQLSEPKLEASNSKTQLLEFETQISHSETQVTRFTNITNNVILDYDVLIMNNSDISHLEHEVMKALNN